MTKGCGQYEDAILDLVYGELDDAAAEAFRAHAANCPACAGAVEGLSSVRRLSSQAVISPPPTIIDTAVLAAARDAVAETKTAPSPARRPVQDDKPGFFEVLRSFLLHPAFAGAAVLCLVLVVSFFVSEKGRTPEAPTSNVESVLAERPREIESAKPAFEEKKVVDPVLPTLAPTARDEAQAKAALPSKDLSTVQPAPEPITPDRLRSTEINDAKADLSGRKAKREQRPASRRASPSSASGAGRSSPPASPTYAPSPSMEPGGGYSAAKGAPAPKPSKSAWNEPGSIDDLDGFAPPPSDKKRAYRRMAEEASAAEDDMAAPYAGAPSSAAPESDMSPPKLNKMDDYTRGKAAYQRGDCTEAVAAFSIVIADPGAYPGRAASALHHIARCEKRRGRCAGAVIRYEALLDRYPSYNDTAEALYEAAQCYKRLGRSDRARTLLRTLQTYPGWETRAEEALSGM